MNTKLWFRRKQYGWGWYPCAWQGWAILALYILGIATGAQLLIYCTHNMASSVWVPILYIVQNIILTILLIIICYTTGEKPRWQWGKNEDTDKNN